MLLAFLTLMLDGGEWSASHSGCFTSWEKTGTHRVGGFVGPRAGLDTVAKREGSCPCWESKPNHPACKLVTVVTSFSGSLVEQFTVIEIVGACVCFRAPSVHIYWGWTLGRMQ
jgi:hypothetical protein